MTPLWFPHAHDHRSKLPSQWSTWEEGNFSTPNPTWQIWSRCCKASDPNNKIQLGCNWLEAYSACDTFKGHNIALNHRVMNSTGNAPEKLTLSDTTFTRDSLALNHGVQNSTANVPNRDAPMEQTHSRTLLLDTELFISRLPDNKKRQYCTKPWCPGVRWKCPNETHYRTPSWPLTMSHLCGYYTLPALTVSLQGHWSLKPIAPQRQNYPRCWFPYQVSW